MICVYTTPALAHQGTRSCTCDMLCWHVSVSHLTTPSSHTTLHSGAGLPFNGFTYTIWSLGVCSPTSWHLWYCTFL